MWSDNGNAKGRAALGLVLLGAFAACQRDGGAPPAAPATPAATAARITPEAIAAEQAITGERIRGVVAEISADEYGGRSPGSPGETKRASVLAAELARSASPPALPKAPTSSLRSRGSHGGGAADLAVHAAATSRRARAQRRFHRRQRPASGHGRGSRRRARVRRVRIEAPEYDWDDFKDVDVRGKVLVDAEQRSRLGSEAVRGRDAPLLRPLELQVRERGAPRGGRRDHHSYDASAGYRWQVVQTSWSGRSTSCLPGPSRVSQLRSWVTEDAARRWLLGEHDLDSLIEQAKSRDFRPVPLGITTSFDVTNKLERTPTANVLGVMRGSDPRSPTNTSCTRRTTIISEKANPTPKATRLQRRTRQRDRCRACSCRSAKRSPRYRSVRAARSCCSSSPPKSRG